MTRKWKYFHGFLRFTDGEYTVYVNFRLGLFSQKLKLSFISFQAPESFVHLQTTIYFGWNLRAVWSSLTARVTRYSEINILKNILNTVILWNYKNTFVLAKNLFNTAWTHTKISFFLCIKVLYLILFERQKFRNSVIFHYSPASFCGVPLGSVLGPIVFSLYMLLLSYFVINTMLHDIFMLMMYNLLQASDCEESNALMTCYHDTVLQLNKTECLMPTECLICSHHHIHVNQSKCYYHKFSQAIKKPGSGLRFKA